MTLHSSRVSAFVALFATMLGGCSLAFPDDRYRGDGQDGGRNDAGRTDGGPRDATVDAPSLCTPGSCGAGRRCVEGACVTCDADGDGSPVDDRQCGAGPFDCDDDDDQVYPGAPAVCGDGRVNACPGTGLEVPAGLATALAAAEVGLLPNRQVDLFDTGGYFDTAHLAPLRGSDGIVRLVVTYTRSSATRDDSHGFVHLLEGSTLETLQTVDLTAAVAPGFFLTGARALSDGSVRLAAMRFGAMYGEIHRALIAAGSTSLDGLTYQRRDAAGTCLVTDGAFAPPRYPFGDLLVNGLGEVGGYNRYRESAPYFRIAVDGAVTCRALSSFYSPTTLVASGGRAFAYWDDNEANTGLSIWDRPNGVSTFSVGTGLTINAGQASMDSIGVESGSHRERLLITALGPLSDSVVAVPVDCTVDSPSTDCSRAAAASTYRPTTGSVSSPLVRRLNARSALLLWLESRETGARPPNNRVQELVAHVTDRGGAIAYATAGDPGAGLPVLRYELDDSSPDYRLAKMLDVAVSRDPMTGDLTLYAVGIYSRWVATTLELPTASEVRVGGVRVCAAP
jgi:hypothetical protein